MAADSGFPYFHGHVGFHPVSGTIPPEPAVAEALSELGQYLSDQFAPLMVADSVTVLTHVPAERVADQIEAWAEGQRAGSGLPVTDYLFHGLRKVQIVGEFGLVPPSLFTPFMKALQAATLQRAPASDRARLASDLARLGDARTMTLDQVELIHRPGSEGAPPTPGWPEAPSETPELGTGRPVPRRRSGGVRLNVPPGMRVSPEIVRRLNLILERLSDLAPSVPADQKSVLAAEAFATVSAAASSPEEMDEQLREFQSAGLAKGTYDVFQALTENLPGWWTPGLPENERTDPGLVAMHRLVTLAADRVEASRRLREMVETAIEQFNVGALGRAVRMFALVLKMTERGDVAPEMIESLRANGHHSLDPERMQELLKAHERHGFPRVVMRFFRAFAPERLLDELGQESRRDRRNVLLALMETHGDEGRLAVFERLVRTPLELRDYYLFRNLVHLLRTIPRSVNTSWEAEHEIARVIRLLVPESPPFLVKDIMAYLASLHQRLAHQAIFLFLEGLEGALESPATPAGDRAQLLECLDQICSVLAEGDDSPGWAAVARHGLREDPRLGNTLARLGELGRRDLSGAPELVDRLVTAGFEELRDRRRGSPAESEGRRLRQIVAALALTWTPQTRAFFELLATRLPEEDEVAREAARILRTIASPEVSAVPKGSLVGDLETFALPTLLQNLAELKSTGTLTVMDDEGRSVAALAIEGGLVHDARHEDLVGAEAVYELLERPFSGRFAFVPNPAAAAGAFGSPLEVVPLLLEGMRRYDELRRSEALIPGDAVFSVMKPTQLKVPGEKDAHFVSQLWGALTRGATVEECERTLRVDAYRIRYATAFWVQQGTLEVAWPWATGSS